MGSQGYNSLPSYYVQSSDPVTPKGFSLKGMDPILAENFVLIDAAIGGGGSTPGGPTNSIQYNAGGTLGGLSNFLIDPTSGEVTLIDSASTPTGLAALSVYGNGTDDIQDWYIDGSETPGTPDVFLDTNAGLNWAADGAINVGGNGLDITVNGNNIVSVFGSGIRQTIVIQNENNTDITLTGADGSLHLDSSGITYMGADAGVLVGAATPGGAQGSSTLNASGLFVNGVAVGFGTVTAFSAGSLSPLFTTSVATSTTTPALSFSLSNAAQNSVLAGPPSGGTGAPSYQTAPTISAANMTSFPTFNQNTSGTAANLSGTPTLPNGTAATTQTTGDTSTNLATDAFVAAAIAAYTAPVTSVFTRTGAVTAQSGDYTAAQVGAISASLMTTLGDIIYENATPAAARLAGNITATKMYLSQTGNGTISAVPAWAQINYADITGTTPTPPSGAVLWSALGNAGGNLSLSNAANTTTFNQTTNAIWLWANTTTGTSGTTNASPLIELGAQYYTGSATGNDVWSIGSSLAAGTNGAPTLNITHSGSTGAARIIAPNVANVYGWAGGTGGFGPAASGANIPAAFVSGAESYRFAANSLQTATSIGLDIAGGVGVVGKFSVASATGFVSRYGNIATVSGGVPSELAVSDLTAQVAAITATTLYATTATGMYRVSWSATITTVDGVSSVLGGTGGFQVLYTSPTDSVVKTTVAGNSVTSSANTTGTAVGGCEVIYCKTGTNIQFQYGYTSATPGQMAFELHCKVEAL